MSLNFFLSLKRNFIFDYEISRNRDFIGLPSRNWTIKDFFRKENFIFLAEKRVNGSSNLFESSKVRELINFLLKIDNKFFGVNYFNLIIEFYR